MRKNVKKKSLKYLEITFRKPYLCTHFERESNAPEQRQVLKKFWKKFRKFLEFPKFDLPLHPLWQWHPVGDEAKKVHSHATFLALAKSEYVRLCARLKKRFWKIFWKKSSEKIWRFQKRFLPLHHFPLCESSGRNSGGRPPETNRNRSL